MSDLEPAQRRQLESRAIPFVVVDTAGEQPAGIPTVGSQNWNGGLAATRHLLGLGHRRIAVIAGPTDVLCSRARIDGYRTALDEVGAPVDPGLVRHGDFFVRGGYQHGLDLLGQPEALTEIAPAIAATTRLLVDRLAADGLNLLSSTGTAAGQEVFHLHVHLIPRFAHRAGIGQLTVREPGIDLDRVHRQITGG